MLDMAFQHMFSKPKLLRDGDSKVPSGRQAGRIRYVEVSPVQMLPRFIVIMSLFFLGGRGR